MRLLILGGTEFLGRHLTEAALEQGHEVTLFNRGRSNPELFPEAEKLHGDRNGDLSALEGRSWDAAVDTSGYLPRQVRASAGLLAEAVEHYTFVSSISVYEEYAALGLAENAPLRASPDPEPEVMDWELYGELKAGCERAAEEAMPNRTLVVRPGLIAGPGDYMDRFPYWCRRIAEGGEVLAPGDPERQVQLVDARDLADWMLRMAEARRAGLYNATGPRQYLTMRGMLEEIRAAAGSDAWFVWVPDVFLLDEGVGPWEEMPFWVPQELAGILAVDVGKALGAGLAFRPLADIARDTLAWLPRRGKAPEISSGISREKERELLDSWHALESRADGARR